MLSRKLVLFSFLLSQPPNLQQPPDHILVPEMGIMLELRLLIIRDPRRINQNPSRHAEDTETSQAVQRIGFPRRGRTRDFRPGLRDGLAGDGNVEVVHVPAALVPVGPAAAVPLGREPGRLDAGALLCRRGGGAAQRLVGLAQEVAERGREDGGDFLGVEARDQRALDAGDRRGRVARCGAGGGWGRARGEEGHAGPHAELGPGEVRGQLAQVLDAEGGREFGV